MKISSIDIHNFRSIKDASLTMNDYSLLVGGNNTGKSNIIDAIRIFYEKNIKYDDSRDFPKFPNIADRESWIDIEFKLSEVEYQSLKEEYKGPNNTVKVRKFLLTEEKGPDGKIKQGIFAYIDGTISNEHFYGAKNVQQGKLGSVIYIPAASRLDDHTKLSGPSALRDILSDILKKLIVASPSFASLTNSFRIFEEEFKTEKTSDNKSLLGLESEINNNLNEWSASFKLEINSVSETDIVKNLVGYKILDQSLNAKLDASQFGQGFQRHLIYTLLKLASKYQANTTHNNKKDFTPDLTLLLFEEPEAYLHPTQQDILCFSLQAISSQKESQVIISSHSPHFVSHNSDDIPSIIRLCRKNCETIIGQIPPEALTKLFSDNMAINQLVKDTKYEPDADDISNEAEAAKYFLWLNSERCAVFFSNHVLLVEGPSEKIAIDYLIKSNKLQLPPGGIYVLECMGKFNIHRFMNLLSALNVQHSVLIDDDLCKPPHDKIKSLIINSTSNCSEHIAMIPGDIEDFLQIQKPSRPHRKPQSMIMKLQAGTIPSQQLDHLISLIETIIGTRDKSQLDATLSEMLCQQ